MQAIKEKLDDMNAMRKAKAEAKEEEKDERELAKVRKEVAREVRMAKEAEAAMNLHMDKAASKEADLLQSGIHQGQAYSCNTQTTPASAHDSMDSTASISGSTDGSSGSSCGPEIHGV